MLKKKTKTAIIGGALVVSTVVFGVASAETMPENNGRHGVMHTPRAASPKRNHKKETNMGASHGIVTALIDDGFAMEARSKTGSTTVMVHLGDQTIYHKDHAISDRSSVTLGARVLVKGIKDSLGTSQEATSVAVITKSFGSHPFPERLKKMKMQKEKDL